MVQNQQGNTPNPHDSAKVGLVLFGVAGACVAVVTWVLWSSQAALLVFAGAIVLGLIWAVMLMSTNINHRAYMERRIVDAQATKIENESEAAIVLAKTEHAKQVAQAKIAIAQASRPMISAAPKVDESQLRTRDIPDGRGGYFNIPITQLRALMAAYPATSRSQLEAAKVVSGGTDAQRLIGAAIFFGWMGKDRNNGSNGKGVEAEWVMEMAQVRQSFYGIYYESMELAKKSVTGGAHSAPLLVEGVSRPVD